MTQSLFSARKQYGAILADPPWPERGGGKVKRGADRHYPLMEVTDIARLCPMNAAVVEHALPDSHLYLWATNNWLQSAFYVMNAWGFRFVTMITWGKVSESGAIQTGLGQYFRGATEHLLFGVRGQPPYRKLSDGKRAQGSTLVLAPRDEHSRKPSAFHDTIERVSAGPYLELFARRPRLGWTVWGNEVTTAAPMTDAVSASAGETQTVPASPPTSGAVLPLAEPKHLPPPPPEDLPF